jgi:adenylate cyclase
MEERAKLQALLDAFVAKPVARQLREGVVHPGGGRFRVSVLFADIRGFTKETVSMRADEVIVLLNSCFEMICPPIEECGGVIDKFIGDEVMAIFGAPDPLSDHANWALKAALGMRKALQEFNQGRAARQLPPVALGWGIASGEVTAGIVGSKDRSNFTALGTVVNRASRLCDAAAPWEILLDPVTAQEASLEGIPFQEEQILLEGLGTETVIRIPPPAL